MQLHTRNEVYLWVSVGLVCLSMLFLMLDFLWSLYIIGQTVIFLPCVYFFLSFFSFPRLISAVPDWMSTIVPHMVWP